jgi:hypothetical protein
MDPITLRFIERLLAVAIGGMAIFLGYRLFLKIPESRDSQGKITLPWSITVALSRVGPGVFFALFGAAVVALSLQKGLEIGAGALADAGTFKWSAAPPVAAESAARADARALLRRDIGLLNNIGPALRPDLAAHERTPIDLAIPRIKAALMQPVWGSADEGWGSVAEFDAWVKAGEPDPIPTRIARAVELWRYARRETKP